MRPLVVGLSELNPMMMGFAMRRGLARGAMRRVMGEPGLRTGAVGGIVGLRRMYGTAPRHSASTSWTFRHISHTSRPGLLHQPRHTAPYAKRYVESQTTPPPPTTAAQETKGHYLTRPLPKPTSPFIRFFIRGCFYIGIFVGGVFTLIIGFFLYDASTYSELPQIEDIHTSSLALEPRIGGPKNLPIVEHFVDDDDDDCKKNSKHQPKLVILGTGWGAVALLKTLRPEDYHITVISPSNQFLFTPMLPSATVGTLELRSLVEPVRKIVNRVHGHFLKAMAVDVVFGERLVEVEAVDAKGVKTAFYVPYDKLVVACGKRSLRLVKMKLIE
jgi:hypothetical protein